MELSPQSVAQTTFKTVKKGYDPNEVRAYLARLATAIEATQTQAAAMEARARAAVARLQELATQPAAQPSAPAAATVATPAERDASVDEAQTISRTLLLAQRTADATIAEANTEAKRIRDEAESIAQRDLDSAREAQARLIEEAKAEARKASEEQRVQIDSEVQALLARREFLLSDVEHLEQHVITHRERLRDVASSLTAIADGASGGLADLRRPLMSAVGEDEEPLDPTMPISMIPAAPEEGETTATGSGTADADTDTVDGAEIADVEQSESTPVGRDVDVDDDVDDDDDAQPSGDPTPAAGSASIPDAPTMQIPTLPGRGDDLFTLHRDEPR